MTQYKIPKILHYFWFGGNKPKEVQECIASWRKVLPDYVIIEWNEQNIDINICKFSHRAFVLKKWAFVTDVLRLWVINNYGGIYLDTDVEVL